MIDCDVLRHAECEGCFSHGGSCGENDEVRLVPAGGDSVQFVESGWNSAHTVRSCCRLSQHFVGFVDDGVNLCVVLFQTGLCQFEESSLRLLHEQIDVLCAVERLFADVSGEGDEFACQCFLCNDSRVIFNVYGRDDESAEFGDVEESAGFLEFFLRAQKVGDGEDVHRLLLHVETDDGFVDELVAVVIETLGTEDFAHLEVGVLLNHQCSEHSLLKFDGLRLKMTRQVFRCGTRETLAVARIFGFGVVVVGHECRCAGGAGRFKI